jgi:putative exosortase-associated protein (TIGR04073 family)
MYRSISILGCLTVVAILMVGCSGPEKKLGRGISNVTEFARMGEMRRSVEQKMLKDGHQKAYTTGVIHGFNRSVARTLVGVYEIVTFPIPSYDPYFAPGNKYYPDAKVDPVYPDSYKPGLYSETTFQNDSELGFVGGDLAPFVPGSRFRIFDY